MNLPFQTENIRSNIKNDLVKSALDHFNVRRFSHMQLMENSPILKFKQAIDDAERGKHIIEARILLFQTGLISKREFLEKISDDVEIFFIEPWLLDRNDPVVKNLFSRLHEDGNESQFEDAVRDKKIEILNNLDFGFLVDEIIQSDSEKSRTDRIKDPELGNVINAYEIELAKAESNEMYLSGVILIGAIIEAKLLQVCQKQAEKLKAHLQIIGKTAYKIKNSNEPSSWTLESMINILSDVKIIKNETTDFGELNCAKLAHLIRSSRNLIHPNRALEGFREIELIDQRYWDAKAALSILIYQISNSDESSNGSVCT